MLASKADIKRDGHYCRAGVQLLMSVMVLPGCSEDDVSRFLTHLFLR